MTDDHSRIHRSLDQPRAAAARRRNRHPAAMIFSPNAAACCNRRRRFWIDGKFDDHGKWMDGWETRRAAQRRLRSRDRRLGLPGEIKGVDIDGEPFHRQLPAGGVARSLRLRRRARLTRPSGSADRIESACAATVTIISPSTRGRAFTHVRLNIYPMAASRACACTAGRCRCQPRSRAWSTTSPRSNWVRAQSPGTIRTTARLPTCSRAAAAINMGRRLGNAPPARAGQRLVHHRTGPAGPSRRSIDTAHFKGNYPDRLSLQAARVEGGTADSIVTQSQFWAELLPPQNFEMDAEHRFSDAVNAIGPVTHVRVNVFPDGGLSRRAAVGENRWLSASSSSR